MVLSLDIKESSFDIPGEPEKYSCSCPAADGSTEDYYCPYVNTSREFYYLVKVQNWGREETGEVTISDELDSQLDYVPGTTEYATKFNDKGDGTDWTVIPDKDGGKFPLSGSGYQLAEKMRACREEGGKKICSDKILVRYKVRPKKGIEKNYVFTNIALLKDFKSDTLYKTNTSYPLKLKPVDCVPDVQCASPTPEMCGGIRTDDGDTGDSADTNPDTGDTADTDSAGDDDTDSTDDSGDSGRKQGELYGECYQNNTCNEGLVCDTENNICIKDGNNSDNNSGNSSDSGDSGNGDGNNNKDSDSDDSDSGNSGNLPKQGERGGKCYPNETCNKGLTCDTKHNVCIKAAENKTSDGCSVLMID